MRVSTAEGMSAMWEYTVNVQAMGTPDAPIDVSDDSLESVYEALLERGDLIGPAVGANCAEHRVLVTATIAADSQDDANQRVAAALGEVLVSVGLIQGFVATATSYAMA